MRLRGEAYSARLREYSDDTMRLISMADSGCKTAEELEMVTQITAEDTLTEEQVVEKLNELSDTILTKTEAKK